MPKRKAPRVRGAGVVEVMLLHTADECIVLKDRWLAAIELATAVLENCGRGGGATVKVCLEPSDDEPARMQAVSEAALRDVHVGRVERQLALAAAVLHGLLRRFVPGHELPCILAARAAGLRLDGYGLSFRQIRFELARALAASLNSERRLPTVPLVLAHSGDPAISVPLCGAGKSAAGDFWPSVAPAPAHNGGRPAGRPLQSPVTPLTHSALWGSGRDSFYSARQYYRG